MAIFVLVKKFGRPIVEAFVDEKQLKFKFCQMRKANCYPYNPHLIPGIPMTLSHISSPLTPISKKDFFYYVMPADFQP